MSDYKPQAGWKLVPVEPTPEMIEQGSSTINDSGGSARWSETREAWAAMLAAAPTPPVHAENTSQERVRNQAENEHIRMPEPMSEDELVEIYRALPKNSPIVRDGSATIRLGRAVEAEVIRRVMEANK